MKEVKYKIEYKENCEDCKRDLYMQILERPFEVALDLTDILTL